MASGTIPIDLLKVYSLVVYQSIADGQTYTTLNSRKFSDYTFLIFIGRVSSSDSIYRTSFFLPSSYFCNSNRVANMQANHGSNLENISGIEVKYISDTQYKITLLGSKAFNILDILGVKLN